MAFNRAFVAAPLIGTIIFLAAIMFAVNLSKTDASEVTRIVGDAYHNRLVSLLEMYRIDLGSVFSVGLSRSIESFLTRECWISEPFKISTTGEEGEAGIRQARYHNCVLFNRILKSVVCSLDPRYGMKNWLAKMNETMTFEGVLFEPANREAFQDFLYRGWGQSAFDSSSQSYGVGDSGLCEVLMAGSIMDCYSFAYGEGTPSSPAKPKLQCCSIPDDEREPLKCEDRGDKVKGSKVEGCESGIFYVALKIEDVNVFPRMPRVSAKDGLGNEIRSGAISDKDFVIPINYPLFKYYDDAFYFYETLATNQDGSARGIFSGLCYGPQQDQGGRGCPPGTEKAAADKNKPQDDAASELFDLFAAAKAKDNIRDRYGVAVQKRDESFAASDDDLRSVFKSEKAGDQPSGYADVAAGATEPYYLFDEVTLSVNFNDTETAYQVSPVKPNSFCWTADPKYGQGG